MEKTLKLPFLTTVYVEKTTFMLLVEIKSFRIKLLFDRNREHFVFPQDSSECTCAANALVYLTHLGKYCIF